MYRLLTVHIVGSFTYSGLCFSVFCVLEVLCLILVRNMLEVFGHGHGASAKHFSTRGTFLMSSSPKFLRL